MGFITSVKDKVKIDRETAAMLAACGKPTIITENNNQNQTIMDIKLLALLVGLPETATEEQVKAKIEALKAAAATSATLQDEITAMRKNQIAAVVENAIAAKKITADKKEHFVAIGEKIGLESLNATLDAMQVAVKPTDVITQGGSGSSGTGTPKTWSELTIEERITLRAENIDEYKRLYKAEYGVDAIIK